MPVVQMLGVTKRFGALVANDSVDLDVEPNEIHALLGENGAGKTTLMKVLYGLYQPDSGQILIDGKPVRLKSPADAIAHGIGYVSQHFSLVPTLTVAENIVLGYEGGAVLNQEAMRHAVETLAAQFSFQIDPRAVVRDLAVGQQQRVEILKALYRNCRVLILDEPTAVLTPQDAQSLFQTLRQLQQKHLSVVIITHKLEEVMAISQRVTVLRLGKVVGRRSTAETTQQELANLMVGRDTVIVTRNENHQRGSTGALTVDGLRLADKRGVPILRAVDFRIRSSEIVGLAGVAGNGQSELVAILNGMLLPDSGNVLVNGKAVKLGDPREFNRASVGRIPEDRLKGVVGDLTVAQNLTIEMLDDYTQAGHLKQGEMQKTAERLIHDFQIKAEPNDRVRTLSGGNIQKIILARTLSRSPAVVIAAQPTRGLDVGATEYVHQKLLEQKVRGAGVLLVSEDLDEIMILSDRILVIYEGQIVGEFEGAIASIEVIGLLMAGSKVEREIITQS
jgi:general nucleoside transport system ATP-binding protein